MSGQRGLIADFHGHQAWADAEHWRALLAHPPALSDARLFERLHHIHVVQHAFLCIATGQSYQGRAVSEFDPPALLAWARQYHEAAAGVVGALDEAALEREVGVPWFQDPPCRITLAEALTQAALHSHYHRGQNATRLRELGGHPPLTDLIIWYWKGRPRPAWP
jgi:uncharacterized damage-inducible protein DinB